MIIPADVTNLASVTGILKNAFDFAGKKEKAE
jgi:NAD(P)H-dependent FMN reductase